LRGNLEIHPIFCEVSHDRVALCLALILCFGWPPAAAALTRPGADRRIQTVIDENGRVLLMTGLPSLSATAFR
jgi:hypothetical protein